MTHKLPKRTIGLFSNNKEKSQELEAKTPTVKKNKKDMKEIGRFQRFIAEEAEDALAEIHGSKADYDESEYDDDESYNMGSR